RFSILPTLFESDISNMLTLQQIDEARLSAGPAQDWLGFLEAHTAQSRAMLLEQVGQLTGYSVLGAGVAWPFEPDFEQLSYADMAQRQVVVGRDKEGRWHAAFGLALSPQTGEWFASLGLMFHDIYLTDPQALRAKLESHESEFSAVADAVGLEEHVGDLTRDDSTDLTLSSIQGESSPAVRLINSTVFDALRFEASDIHLESLPQGLVIKFRIDGVLNRIA